MFDTFSAHLNLAAPQSEILLDQPLDTLLHSPELAALLDQLNTERLRESLPIAGTVLEQHLPLFYDWLKNELGLKRVPDGPDHTTKWVVGFLKNQETIEHLIDLHKSIPSPALERSIPRLVALFDTVDQAEIRQEWQKAVSALCLVLAVAARDRDRVQSAGATTV